MKLPSVYQPSKYEADIYALWERSRVFEPVDRSGERRFSTVLPPPNANGDLHMGHALTVAIEDSIVRYWRLQGGPTLYIPGADHAGFETWVVFEKMLNQQGKSRFSYSREELYRMVWDFVQQNKHNFESQLRGLGTSVDWSRYTFTLDNKVVATAYDTFKKMWQDGLVYRGLRVVNYCTFHGTSFSDIEVVYEEEKSKLWYIAYPLKAGQGELIVATTRPETMLGDTAVAVNPKDPRYRQFVGQMVTLPLSNREIPIVADEAVDPDFGSGAVKVTPAHDAGDFELAARHKLPLLQVITTEGKMNDNAPEAFRGMAITQARQAVVKALELAGYLKKVEDYTHSVGKCYKCATIIEPLPLEQWFVRMRPLANRAIEALKKNQIDFHPKSKLADTLRYLSEVKDWNISRQIAWGIPIPAFRNIQKPDEWIFDINVSEETLRIGDKTYRRDPDVFDTWFSSGQWPYVTLDWPNSEDFERFYPLDLLETGGEILYQWVARMIMLGLYTTGKVPFKTVYIHGYVMAEDGRKMSKSLGNVVNPLEIIAADGSDALRMGLLTGRRAGVNQGYHPAKVKAARNFANKLWNMARFIEAQVGDDHALKAEARPTARADHWILSRFSATTDEIARSMEAYRLSEAYEALYHFVWHDAADWYLEINKSQPNNALLAYLLESILKIAHPFAPFLTETIWQTLAWEEGRVLAAEKWPAKVEFSKRAATEFSEVMAVIKETRHIANALQVSRPTLYYHRAPLLQQEISLVSRLGRLNSAVEAEGEMPQGLKLTNTAMDVWLDIDQQTAEKYLSSLRRKHLELQVSVKKLEARVANPRYRHRAPKQLVEQSRHLLAQQKQALADLEEELKKFPSLTEDL